MNVTADQHFVALGGLPIWVIDREDSARFMVEQARARRGSGQPPVYITSANGQVLSICARDRDIRDLFLSADLIHADGMPLVFASRFNSSTPLPERVATTDLFHDVAKLADASDLRFFLLGGTKPVIEAAVQKVRRLYPKLTIAGYRHGYSRRTDDKESVIAQINAARPDILWVGMGVPLEQAFVVDIRARLTEVGLIKTSGGLFDFLAERNSRAPQWMQAAGLEWVYRAALEPRRLLVRYLTTSPHALFLLLKRPVRQRDDASSQSAR